MPMWFILFVQLMVLSTGENCSPFGYYKIPEFGHNCQYRCRCVNEEQCGRDTGSCQNGCARGWMGPGCQYRNVAAFNGGAKQKINTSSVASLAVDSDVATCINIFTAEGQDTWWSVKLHNPYYIVGLVLKIKKATTLAFRVDGSIDDFKTTIMCYQQTETLLPTELEMMCLDQMTAQDVRITAPATSQAFELCEVELYGGRYISYKGQAAQSTIFWGTAAAAVDGRPMLDGDDQEVDAQRTCAVTTGQWGASWGLTFTNYMFIQGVDIYGRRLPIHPYLYGQSAGFIVHVEPNNEPQTLIYEDNAHGHTWQDYQPRKVHLARPRRGRGVYIQHRASTLDHLSLCEIEVFADCEKDLCGWNCSDVCHCATITTGSYRKDGKCPYGCKQRWTGHNGRCDSTCPDGMWGSNCMFDCYNCRDNTQCNIDNGTCPAGCGPGWKTPFCNATCDNNMYGENCNEPCGQCRYKAQCNTFTGDCPGECEPGWQGSICKNECDDQFYGDGCNKTCGHCFDSSPCNKVNGTCHSCNPGYKGDDCKTGCEDRNYGYNCNETCGKCKNEERCHATTGLCVNGCEPGWQGSSCKNECDNFYYGQGCNQLCGHCLHPLLCDKIDGHCNSCDAGYNGYLCKNTCINGTYGPDCKELCGMCRNNAACDIVNGTCPGDCEPGKQGQLCKEDCEDGFYGFGCNMSCGNCQYKPCHKGMGNCNSGCEAGYKGKLCKEACAEYTYGLNCVETCGNCTNSTSCNRYDGECIGGCMPGYTEPLCKPLTAIEDESDSSVGRIIGIIIGVLVAVAVTIIVIIVIQRRAAKVLNLLYGKDVDGHGKPTKDIAPLEEQTTSDITYSTIKGSNIGYDDDSSDTADYINKNSVSKVVPLLGLKAYCQKMKLDPSPLFADFEQLPFGRQFDTKKALKPTNVRKNRYRELYPYDKNVVVLPEIPGVADSDYISASYINGVNTEHRYIACQGAMKNTVNDVWRMVWSHDIAIIVMLTKIYELGKLKCERYWPKEGSKQYDNITVKLQMEDVCSDHCIRTFELQKVGTSQIKRTTQYHFTGWPDKDVPDEILSLVQFWRSVKQSENADHSPWMIHCSAGIGRTGTFIALDYLYDEGNKKNCVDVKQCVHGLRDQRVNMVQTKDQYVFVHHAIQEAINPVGETFRTDEFQEKWEAVTRKGDKMGKDKLSTEFKTILDDSDRMQEDNVYETFDTSFTKDDFSDSLKPENTDKSRRLDILPPNRYRPILAVTPANQNNYINAVLMYTFRMKDGLILNQLPLPHTVEDTLRLIWQFAISTVVVMEHKIPQDCKYWSDTPHVDTNIGEFTVQLVSADCTNGIITRKIKIKHQQSSEVKEVNQLHYQKWPEGCEVPVDIGSILRLITDAETLVRVAGSGGPLLVQCLDGATRTGLFCMLWSILERINSDQTVAIANTVRLARVRRKQIIPTYEQYRFCWETAKEYIDGTTVYGNVM